MVDDVVWDVHFGGDTEASLLECVAEYFLEVGFLVIEASRELPLGPVGGLGDCFHLLLLPTVKKQDFSAMWVYWSGIVVSLVLGYILQKGENDQLEKELRAEMVTLESLEEEIRR